MGGWGRGRAGVRRDDDGSLRSHFDEVRQLHRSHQGLPARCRPGRATDRIAGTSRPVNTWRRDTAAYNLAMHDNRGLDRDRDNFAWVRR